MSKYIRILIVDDEKASRESLKMLLDSVGYSTEIAESGEEAMRLLKTEPFEGIRDLLLAGEIQREIDCTPSLFLSSVRTNPREQNHFNVCKEFIPVLPP